jgi:hypothetical protein
LLPNIAVMKFTSATIFPVNVWADAGFMVQTVRPSSCVRRYLQLLTDNAVAYK